MCCIFVVHDLKLGIIMGKLNVDIRTWYINEYPDDELVSEILDGLLFGDLWDGLLLGGGGFDVYSFLGVYESDIRERVFEGLCVFMGVDYDVVYNMWLGK